MIFLFVFFIIGYAFTRTKTLVQGPSIEIFSPKMGEVVHHELIEVDGKVTNVSTVRLDGREIHTNEKGEFGEKLLVPRGYSILQVEAQDRFKRTERKTLPIIYK